MSNPIPCEPPIGDVRRAVANALQEDLTPLGDLTSSLLPAGLMATADFRAREAGRLAGRACADEAFRQVDADVSISWTAADGDALEAGMVFGQVRGKLSSILTGERTALNFMGHLSGIATGVEQMVAAADGGCRIWDTRKTTPGLRSIEKAAVRAGGGWNHRGNLADWLMFKDNHLVGMSIGDAIEAGRAAWPGRTLQVECDTMDQLVEALAAGADLVLLDNMSPDEVTDCMAVVNEHRENGGRPLLVEASGGITIETVPAYAQTGVDLLSSGSLTNSARVLDIGLDITPDQVA